MKFKGKKFLLIGGAGFIGSHTIDLLLKTNAKQIIVYDNFYRGKKSNLEHSIKDKRVKIFSKKADILNITELEKAIKNVDGVFLFAALWLMECHNFPERAFEVNVKGTFNVINLCVKHKIKKLVFSSSASVYGDSMNNLPIDESHPFNNKNFYGSTKIACEAMLRAFHYRYGLNFIGLRYMNVYGPRQDYKGAYIAVIMKMLDNIFENKKPTIFGNGKESFDFISVRDCARANLLAMKSKNNNCFLNVCTGKKTSLKNLAKILLKLTKSNLKINYKENNLSTTLVKNRIGNPKNAQDKIKFKSKINLEKGLADLIKWRINKN